MTHEEHSAWAENALRYLDALDASDIRMLADLWEQAVGDPQLERVLGELTDGLAVEEGLDAAWQSDALSVRTLLREHLPSAFPAEAELPPLTVSEVAARLQADAASAARWTAEDRVANVRLRANQTPVPEELGLPHFEKWQTTLGVQASSHYWRSFRQAAVLLAMGRCQQAGELAARRAIHVPKGGRP